LTFDPFDLFDPFDPFDPFDLFDPCDPFDSVGDVKGRHDRSMYTLVENPPPDGLIE
jgi:hypothetical protein